MHTGTKEDFLSYIKESGSPFLIGLGIFIFAMGLFSLTVVDSAITLIFAAFFIVLGIFLIYLTINASKKFKSDIQKAEESGEMNWILNDFFQSYPLVDDNIRLGQVYIFGKKKGYPIRYSEIKKVYQYVRKRNFIESSRELRADLHSGQTIPLCDLKLRGKSDEDVARIMGFIRHKNPHVHLGYK